MLHCGCESCRTKTLMTVLGLVALVTGLVLSGQSVSGQPFTAIPQDFPDVFRSSTVFGDYDADGDLDLLVAGNAPGEDVTTVWRNDDTAFVEVSTGLPGAEHPGADWGDYDNDGDLDLLMSMVGAHSVRYMAVFRNDTGQFTEIVLSDSGAAQGAAAWGDYDNDGDLDAAVMGSAPWPTTDLTRIYRNDGADTFVNIGAGLAGFRRGSIDWGDYDNDGDLDLFQTGIDIVPRTNLYRNDGNGVFTPVEAGFFHLYDGEGEWGDIDQDGDLDIIVDGSDSTSAGFHTFVYRNDGNDQFTDLEATLPGAGEGSNLIVGDCNNDGRLDLYLSGVLFEPSDIWVHDGANVFAPLNAGLRDGCCGSAGFGDYDGDGDLDIVTAVITFGTDFYKNETALQNTQPLAPSGLTSVVSNDTVLLAWLPGSDAETSTPGLTCNVRVGSTPGGVDILSPMADVATGKRYIVERGNADHRLFHRLVNLADGQYFWSVQSIDNSYVGSEFSAESSFVIGDTLSCCIGQRGNVDNSSDEQPTLGDLTAMIDHLFISLAPPVCVEEGNLDGSVPEGPGSITLGDLTIMIDHLFISLAPLSACP